ncbi:hypothetical protein IAT40_001800 [Kwoniella sp. CBS 6097]
MPSSASRRSRSSLLDIQVFADLPPGSYHSADENEDEDDPGIQSDSSVQAYDEPPEYLKRNTNKLNPIIVESSDNEDNEDNGDNEDNEEEDDEEEDVPLFPADEPAANPTRPETSSDNDELPDEPGPSHGVLRKRSRKELDGNSRPLRSDKSRRDLKCPKRNTPAVQPPPPKNQPITGASVPPVSDAADPSPDRSVQDDPLAVVLDVLPDVDISWVLDTIEGEIAAGRRDNASNRVIEMAFEMEGGYPKAKDKGKSKEKEGEPAVEGAAEEYKSIQYRKDTRVGSTYFENSVQQLEADFPRIPLPFIRTAFYGNGYMYVPAYYWLQDEVKKQAKSYTELKRPRARGKGKSRSANSSQAAQPGCSNLAVNAGLAAFEAELAWLQAAKAKVRCDEDEAEAKRLAHEDAIANGSGIECGCCFGEEVWEEMFQCADGHLFCRECVTKHAETKLGEEKTAILCMDMSSCQSVFPESELTRLLSEKSLSLYHRLKQANELEQAGIEGLESCPNCPFAAVIDNPHEKLFRCMNEECGQVTCRACRRKDHIPKTCAEVEADLKLNNRHTVEDAMSEALIRKCPKCAKPYIKDTGCNKIHCSKCGTLSCYVCQKQIHGYDHFDQNPSDYRAGKTAGKCVLWDSAEAQHDANAVREARDNAQNRVRAAAQANGIDLDDNDLNVDLPDAPAGPPGIPGVPPYMARPGPIVPPHELPGMIHHIGRAFPPPDGPLGAGRAYPPMPAFLQLPPDYPGPPNPPALLPRHRGLRGGGRGALVAGYPPGPRPPAIPGPPPAPYIPPLPAPFRHAQGDADGLLLLQRQAAEAEEIRALLAAGNPPSEERLWRRRGIE